MSDPAGEQSRHYTARIVAAVLLSALTSVAFLLPVPYVSLSPGPAYDTLGEFEGTPTFTFGEGVKTYDTSGTLDFTTVSITSPGNQLTLIEAARRWLERDTAIVPRSLVYPDGTTAKASRAESAAQLVGSKDSSEVAALRAAGYTVTGTPTVAAITDGGAAEGLLEVNDLILAVDGTKVGSSAEAVAAVGKRRPGEKVEVSIRRGGEQSVVSITTKADPEDASVPRIGVALGTQYDFPIEITNNVDDRIGGPSAGTMFALAIYDKLTPGELTGGLKVAGTGEITADGVVGSIGGVQQKIAGAYRAGAKIFLVPAANCGEAVDGDTHGLKLVRIEKLDDAIDSLEKLAADRTASVPTCR